MKADSPPVRLIFGSKVQPAFLLLEVSSNAAQRRFWASSPLVRFMVVLSVLLFNKLPLRTESVLPTEERETYHDYDDKGSKMHFTYGAWKGNRGEFETIPRKA